MEKIILYCLANAGGSSTMYLKWRKFTDEFVEIYPLELPGRGKKTDEAPFSNISDIVDYLYTQIKDNIDEREYAIFGYSMGSLVGYELYYKIKEEGHRLPIHFFAASLEAPQFISTKKTTYNLSANDFKREVLIYNGFPADFLGDESLLNYYLHILRADFEAIETYKYSSEKNLMQTDLTLFYGENDNISLNKVYGWEFLTEKTFQLHKFKGNHFFINENLSEVIEIINDKLKTAFLLKHI
ncbi:thioesterase II family protein [Priestia aryabhattai]|uniref:thioesterase II family protein n=1 Tax=Priestia aryabhattai TaxID=412384 RepID=UPI003D2696B1